jgi:hypothetical protein
MASRPRRERTATDKARGPSSEYCGSIKGLRVRVLFADGFWYTGKVSSHSRSRSSGSG